MTDLAHPEFAPDASLSREEMEALQYEVAETAVFEDDFEFDVSSVRAEATDEKQTHLPTTTTTRPLKTPLSSSAWTKRSWTTSR